MTKQKEFDFKMEFIGDDAFIVSDGVRVAQLDRSNEADDEVSETWLPLRPGWSVTELSWNLGDDD